MSQDSFNAGISWLLNSLLSTWMAPFCLPDHTISPAVKNAIAAAREKGLNVVLTTGRPMRVCTVT
ncbi:sugar phosphate phosphatase [Salmonella enterica subsp. enterica]|uniref:Sugar phosphate phosphatase n=1 Tax=Salmonella enterica I TaxID=59201 RepID=A0A379WJ00_SALET|nr:sugar phosphate phosphatase [Salmonella enterica subsp. enterica]